MFCEVLLLLLLLFVARFLDLENLQTPGFESDAISKLHVVWSTLENLSVLAYREKTTPNSFRKRLYYHLQIPASPFLEASLTSNLVFMTCFGQSK